jgi:hypothetical protein
LEDSPLTKRLGEVLQDIATRRVDSDGKDPPITIEHPQDVDGTVSIGLRLGPDDPGLEATLGQPHGLIH